MKIEVHSVVCENSIPYFDYMTENYRALASADAELEFVAHALSAGTAAALRSSRRASRVVQTYRHARFFVRQTPKDYLRAYLATVGMHTALGGSNGHAAGLNSALALSGGDAIHVIADTDTVILAESWDRIISSLLETYDVVATCYEGIGGFSSGHGKVQTYKRKPSMTWMAIAPGVDFRGLNADPAKDSNIPIDSDELSELYNLPVRYWLVRDVGWKMPLFLRDNDLDYLVFKQVKPSSQESLIIKTGIDYHEEYHLGSKPFVAHQRGSHRHPFRGNEISQTFYSACDKYLSSLVPC